MKDTAKPSMFSVWANGYVAAQRDAVASINLKSVELVLSKLLEANKAGKMVFVFGNGGSASNASHFATDLGKGASEVTERPFKVMSLNDNVSWMTAISNDYDYEDVLVRQLQNYGNSGDMAIAVSVSGNSPNCVKALEWSKRHGLYTVALTGKNECRMRDIADCCISINATHYGRVEDAQMTVLHMLCYAFMENYH